MKGKPKTNSKSNGQSAELLYRISKAMAAVKDGRELLKIIVNETQPIFRFYDIGLAVLDKSGEFLIDWAILYEEINPSEANISQRENNLFKFSVEEPLFKYAITRAEKEKKPFIDNMTAEFIEEFKDFPHLPLEIEYGYKQFLVTTLKFGGKTLGLLNFNSLRENHFDDCDFELFQAIADLVAVAVANITANEEIIERAREKEVLLSISQAIATIQNPEQLFRVIFERVQPIFRFHDVGLFILSKDGRWMTDWAATYEHINPSPGNRQIKEFEMEIFSFENSTIQTIAKRLSDADSPLVFSYHEMIAADVFWQADFKEKLRTVIEEGGYEEFLATRLQTGGTLCGLLFFNSKQSGFFNDKQFAMFQNIADQIAVAVANIIGNEEITEREREKSKLLSISREIAKVQTREQLLNVIFTTVKEIFPYDDAGLFYFCDRDGTPNPRGENYVHLLDDIGSDVNTQIAARNITGVLSERVDSVRFHAEDQPGITTMDELMTRFPGHPFFPIMHADGIKQFITKGIKIGGETIGMLSFNSRTQNFYSAADFPLFDNIANQVAVAVANILANEEIANRTREKSVLLSISEVIATVRSKRDLLKLIIEKIKPVFNFYDCGIFVFDREKHTLEDLVVSFPDISPSEATNLLFAEDNAVFDYEGSVWEEAFEMMRAAGLPVIVNYKNNEFSGWTEYVQAAVIEQIGYEESLMAILATGGEELGVFAINSLNKGTFNENQFSLFQNIANQMAVAVANILANEEILERTREKSVLLSISEDIASARNAVELLQVIREKAQQLIPFYDTGILIVEEDGQHHYDLAVTLQGWDNSESNRKLHDLGLHRMVHPDSYVEYVMRLIEAGNSPVIEDYEQRLNEFDYPFFVTLREFGYREGLGAALKSGGKTFGTFWLNSLKKDHFKLEQFEIFQALADQVAVAVSNILARDEIQKQLSEIKELKKRLEAENTYLIEEVRRNYNFEEIIGTSPRLIQVFEVVETVAPTDATVLIQGETGTGKELIARAIHSRSARNERPLIKLNCAALPRELVESELFGHEKGSFTGAHERRIGKFELADKGTVFLDEIGELPLDMQVKLLRVLQEKEIERLGGKGTIKLDLRIVAATNRNLAQEVQAGSFRADLYYRLCTVEFFVPSLRERREDIEPLTMYFAQKYAAKFSRCIERISTQMLAELNAYDFPGNIRELEHIVEHAVIFSKNETLILPRPLTGNGETQISPNGETNKPPKNEKQTLKSIERDHIIGVLRQTSGRIKGKGGAAEILGLNPATVYFRMKKLGIEK